MDTGAYNYNTTRNKKAQLALGIFAVLRIIPTGNVVEQLTLLLPLLVPLGRSHLWFE